MRTVIVCNIMSLDAYYEGPGRNVMALNMDEAFDAYNLERIRSAGTVLLGRTSYDGFSSYWPGIADAPADPDNRALSDGNRELSGIYNRIEKAVVTDSYAPPTGGTTPRPSYGTETWWTGYQSNESAAPETSSRSAAGLCGTVCSSKG